MIRTPAERSDDRVTVFSRSDAPQPRCKERDGIVTRIPTEPRGWLGGRFSVPSRAYPISAVAETTRTSAVRFTRRSALFAKKWASFDISLVDTESAS